MRTPWVGDKTCSLINVAIPLKTNYSCYLSTDQNNKDTDYNQIISFIIRIKSGEPGFLGFSVPGRLGGVICKPEGAAVGLVKNPPSLRARK